MVSFYILTYKKRTKYFPGNIFEQNTNILQTYLTSITGLTNIEKYYIF